MATEKVRFAYTGAALDGGIMPVRDLAPALLAFADLLEAAYVTIGGSRKIQIMISKDSLHEGSFDVALLLDEVAGFLDGVKQLVGLGEETNFKALMEVIGWVASASGVFALMKELRNRKITRLERIDNGRTLITVDGEETIEASENTLKVYRSVKCRRLIETVLKPLAQDGIDGFELRNPANFADDKPVESVSKGEREYCAAPGPGEAEVLVTPQQDAFAHIVSVNFEDGKWRFKTDETVVFWASVEDKEFLAGMEGGKVAFHKGDMMKMRYHVEQRRCGDKIANEYHVDKVLELIPAPEQVDLDLH